jgi:hypothetical protein
MRHQTLPIKPSPAVLSTIGEVCCILAGAEAEAFVDASGPCSLALHEAGHAVLRKIHGATLVELAIAKELGIGVATASYGIGRQFFGSAPSPRELEQFISELPRDNLRARDLMDLVFGSLGLDCSELVVSQYLDHARKHTLKLLELNKPVLIDLASKLQQEQWLPAPTLTDFFNAKPVQGRIDVEVLVCSVMMLGAPPIGRLS